MEIDSSLRKNVLNKKQDDGLCPKKLRIVTKICSQISSLGREINQKETITRNSKYNSQILLT
jgi:hypothetical protein